MRLPDEIPADVLERLASRDPDQILRLRAAHALGNRSPAPALNPWHHGGGLGTCEDLETVLCGDDQEARLAAAWELGRRGEEIDLRDLLIRRCGFLLSGKELPS